jgi:flagellar biosynthetic protein FlhB
MPADQEGRTEKATPKRRSEVRKKGQVARSMELNSALIILAIFIALKTYGQGVFEGLSNLMRYFLQSPASFELNEKVVANLFLNLTLFFAKIVLPISLVALAVGVVVSIAQTGFLFTLKPLMPSPAKLNPANGIKRIVSPKALVELAKSTAKIAVVGVVAYSIIKGRYSEIMQTIDMDIWAMLATLGSIAYEIGIKVGATLLIIAILDYAYQRYSFEKSIRMTKQEIKDEYRQAEGDPQIKARIKGKQREIARRRMMQAVPTADVVITNPTMLAIALKYDPNTMSAPKVVAKGQRLVAERIRNIARENNVPIVEDKLLARSLYKSTEIDQEVPYDLFKAVAEVLAYVYQINQKKVRR